MNQRNFLTVLSVLAIFLFLFAGCHRYYKAVTRDIRDHPKESIDSLKKDNRYFVLHSGTKAWHLKNVSLSDDRQTLTGTLDTLARIHQTAIANPKMRYKEPYVLTEVHFYIDKDSTLKLGDITLGLDRVQKIEVIEKDKKRTTNSYVIGTIGYVVGGVAVAAIIIAATKSSCPFVSAYLNNEFVLQGEIYGGAIYPQLAREDFMPLRMQVADDGFLRLKISNELKEHQYTDFADLMVISHDKNSEVLADEKGNLYSISNPQAPIAAWSGNQPDALPHLKSKDDNMLLHFDDSTSADGVNVVNLKFKNTSKTKESKLILAVKNSYWLDYLYGELSKSFGSYYARYVKKQNKKPAAELLKWAADEKIPLKVSIKTQTGWREVSSLTTIGPLATRKIVVPVDLSNLPGEDVEIRLSSGFMFWEIDYAAMDFNLDKSFRVQTLSPSTAIDETGKDVLPLLKNHDKIYLEQPVPGNVVTVEYRAVSQKENEEQSYILHTRGYYTHVRDLKGAPKVAFLKQFQKPGRFPIYSMQLYKQFSNSNLASLAKH